jgi:hypothetical protein
MIRKFQGADAYRTFGEARTIENLLVHGWRFDVATGLRDEAEASARAALERCVAIGLPFDSCGKERYFDPVETYNFLKWASVHHGEPTWERQCVACGRRQTWEGLPSPVAWSMPPPPDARGPMRYAVTIRRDFNLEGRKPGERLRLRLPAPIEDRGLTALSVAFLCPEGLDARTTVAPGRLDAVIAAPAEARIELGMRATFTTHAYSEAPDDSLTPADAALYTRPREGLIVVNDRILALAAELAGKDRLTLSIMRRFWNFMFDKFACGGLHYDRLDPAAPLDLVLDEGWFDCVTGSALLVALCRARRIPARLVTGYALHLVASGFHTWLEVWVEDRGWLPFDLACWDLSLGGRDAAWRDYYFGRTERRMVVERPPLVFSGLGSLRLHDPWQMSSELRQPGVMVSFENLRTGVYLYRDQILVECMDNDS